MSGPASREATARAVVCEAYGHWRDMAVTAVPVRRPGPGEVRIAVHAAGVDFANTLKIAGKHQNTPTLPFTPGTEATGVVLECGDGVLRLAPGTRVSAAMQFGAFAEEAIVPARTVFPIPDTLDFVAAVHFPTMYPTAYAALVWKARLAPGETLLVHGAAGGTGLAAVEVGKALGARVIAVAGGKEKTAAVIAQGADHAIDHRHEDIRARVLELTGGRGVDVAFDPVGGDAFDASLRCIAPEGRILTIGYASGRIPVAPANILLVKNVSVTGLYWGYWLGWGRTPPRPVEAALVADGMASLFGWHTAGRLRPVTSRVFPLDGFADAFDLLATRRVIGKVALAVRPQGVRAQDSQAGNSPE